MRAMWQPPCDCTTTPPEKEGSGCIVMPTCQFPHFFVQASCDPSAFILGSVRARTMRSRVYARNMSRCLLRRCTDLAIVHRILELCDPSIAQPEHSNISKVEDQSHHSHDKRTRHNINVRTQNESGVCNCDNNSASIRRLLPFRRAATQLRRNVAHSGTGRTQTAVYASDCSNLPETVPRSIEVEDADSVPSATSVTSHERTFSW